MLQAHLGTGRQRIPRCRLDDDALVGHEVRAQQGFDAVALFEREANEGKDPDLKAFASKSLPTLKEHLKMARKLAGMEEKEDEKGTGRSDKSKKDGKNP